MGDPLRVHLFAEDHAHEAFLSAVLQRVIGEQGLAVDLRDFSARGGHPRVLQELQIYQKSITTAVPNQPFPDLLVVAIDANCERYTRMRDRIKAALLPALKQIAAVACPDPPIERWFLADISAFARVIGKTPKVGRRKCDKDHYKRILAQTVAEAGRISTLGGIEFAEEIVREIEIYQAGKEERSLKAFLDDLRSCLSTSRRGVVSGW